MAHLFEQYWSLHHNRERNDAPAPGMEWEAATPDLVLVSPPRLVTRWRYNELRFKTPALPSLPSNTSVAGPFPV